VPLLILSVSARFPWDVFDKQLERLTADLPAPLADVAYWYPATILSVCILGIFMLNRRRGTLGDCQAVWRPTFFLPTYVAGLESPHLFLWSMRCTPGVPPAPLGKLTWGMVLNAEALLVTVASGTLAALLCGHRSRALLPIPPVVLAIVVGLALPWLMMRTLYWLLLR
jgi:hypothetical protein